MGIEHEEAVNLNDFQPVNILVFETIEMSDLKPPNNNALFPAELLETIFEKLSPQDLKTAVRVCRLWREVGETPKLWTWVSLTITAENMESMMEALTSKRLQGASSLTQQQHPVGVYYTVKQCINCRYFKTLTLKKVTKKQLNPPLRWVKWLFVKKPEVLLRISFHSNKVFFE